MSIENNDRLTQDERRTLGCVCTRLDDKWHHERFCKVPAVETILAARAGEGALRERVEALFAGGPDTPCRTTWREESVMGKVYRTECVEVPVDDLRAALDTAGDPT